MYSNKITIEDFKNTCNTIYNNIFDYSLVQYNMEDTINDIIEIIHPIIGTFKTKSIQHYNEFYPKN